MENRPFGGNKSSKPPFMGGFEKIIRVGRIKKVYSYLFLFLT